MIVGGRAVHLGDDGIERAGHVGAGVAVGHRVDVQPVESVRVVPNGVRKVRTVSRSAAVFNRSSVGTTGKLTRRPAPSKI